MNHYVYPALIDEILAGDGTGSIDRLNSLVGDFNLKLVFALKSGAYLSGVKLTIADAAGKTLVDTASEGPWLLARSAARRGIENLQVPATR